MPFFVEVRRVLAKDCAWLDEIALDSRLDPVALSNFCNRFLEIRVHAEYLGFFEGTRDLPLDDLITLSHQLGESLPISILLLLRRSFPLPVFGGQRLLDSGRFIFPGAPTWLPFRPRHFFCLRGHLYNL